VTSRPARWLLSLALAGVVVAACGKKGPPVAPERRLPVPASALHAQIGEDAIVVSWMLPGSRADASRLKDLTVLTLYRREDPESAPLKPALLSWGRVAGYDEVASIRLASPAPAVVQGNTVQWTDHRALTPGHRFVYVVTATDSLGRTSAPSTRLAVPYMSPPQAPRALQATPGDRKVTLAWEAPAGLADGAPLAGETHYEVLRGIGSEGALSVVTPSAVATPSYTDTGLDNDTEYRYAVQATRVDPRVSSVGPISTVVSVAPLDTTPPSPPTNLAVVPSPGALRLAWTASPEEDVALYAVYRATGAGPFVRIATALAGTTTFIDRDVRSGTQYRYAVTAIDRARTPNESARSNEASATAP
jgi:fibronectin type 3 domain-containing protein